MIPYGKMFQRGEVLLVYMNNEPTFFARVESISPDRKKDWWQLNLLILAQPLKTMTWTLDSDQMRGQTFTIKGVPVEIRRVRAPESDEPEKPKPDTADGNVVSLFDSD